MTHPYRLNTTHLCMGRYHLHQQPVNTRELGLNTSYSLSDRKVHGRVRGYDRNEISVFARSRASGFTASLTSVLMIEAW